MPYLRLSRARYVYQCAGCRTPIRKRDSYFRDEPHPFARMRGEAISKHLCLGCVLGPDNAVKLVRALSSDSDQLPLGFSFTRNGFLRVPPRVEVVDLTPQLLQLLSNEPQRLRELSPAAFEGLICNRLDRLGFEVERVGSGVYNRDGGVDMVAWPRSAPIQYLVAVQAKHTASVSRRIGPAPVRELLGIVQSLGLNAGLLVTNTTFTPDAKWAAAQRARLVQLRDIEDLRSWLQDEELDSHHWRGLPLEIELSPGVVVKIPK